MAETFVRVKRSILHSSIWLTRDAKSIREAFLDILLSVNNEQKSVFLNGKEFVCGRFQSLKSISTWAGRWYCKKRRAQYFLDSLERLGYIRVENMKLTTRITLLNPVRFLYFGSDTYKESVYGLGTGKDEKSVRVTGSKRESSSKVVYDKKNDLRTKQAYKIVDTRKNIKGSSSSLNSSSLNELEKEKIMDDFFENEKKVFEKDNRKQRNPGFIQEAEIIPEQKTVNNFKSVPKRQLNVNEKRVLVIKKWNIAELEDFFKTATLPRNPVKLNGCEVITNVAKFLNTHISIVKAHNGNSAYQPYYERLVTLKELISMN